MKPTVLAVAGAALIATAATACGTSSASPDTTPPTMSAPPPAASATPADAPSASASATASASPAASDTADSTTAAPTRQSGGACRSDDLRFGLTMETQAGGYYLITATARPGVSCTLKGVTVAAAFGSSPDAAAKPAEQAVSESIRLSGSTKAYAGVSPKTGPANGGVQYEQLIVSATDDDPNPVSLALPAAAVVDQPVATNWHASAADAVPLS